MIKAALLLYSAVILGFSAYTHADQVGLPGFAPKGLKIESAEFNVENYLLRVTGTKPTLCYSTPTPMLIPTTPDNMNWTLRVTASASSQMCASAQSPFTLVFDVRTLFYQTNLQGAPGQIVVIKIEGTGDTIEMDTNSARSAFPYSNMIVRGRLEKSEDGHFVLTKAGQVVADLKTAALDLNTFVNHKVEIAGLNLVNVSPIVDLTGSMAHSQSPQDGRILLLVTGISAAGVSP